MANNAIPDMGKSPSGAARIQAQQFHYCLEHVLRTLSNASSPWLLLLISIVPKIQHVQPRSEEGRRASAADATIGSPRRLNDVFRTTGCP